MWSEPNWWATWLACSPNMWLTHCSLCLVHTGLFACKPCLKYSRIHGTKFQSCIECVKGRRLSTVFNDFQLFSMALNGLCGLHDYPTHAQVWWCHLSRSAQNFYFIIPPRPWCLCLV